jgi:hypothetical protein
MSGSSSAPEPLPQPHVKAGERGLHTEPRLFVQNLLIQYLDMFRASTSERRNLLNAFELSSSSHKADAAFFFRKTIFSVSPSDDENVNLTDRFDSLNSVYFRFVAAYALLLSKNGVLTADDIYTNGLESDYIFLVHKHVFKDSSYPNIDLDVSLNANKAIVDYEGFKTNSIKYGKDEGSLNDPLKQLIDRVKDRNDLILACLKFLDTEITKPAYAKLSKELTEARLERERKRQREKKARQRQRQRQTPGPEP